MVLLGAGLATGLVLSWRETVLRWVYGFGAGIDLMLLAYWLAGRAAGPDVVAGVGLAGAAVMVGSLAATASDR